MTTFWWLLYFSFSFNFWKWCMSFYCSFPRCCLCLFITKACLGVYTWWRWGWNFWYGMNFFSSVPWKVRTITTSKHMTDTLRMAALEASVHCYWSLSSTVRCDVRASSHTIWVWDYHVAYWSLYYQVFTAFSARFSTKLERVAFHIQMVKCSHQFSPIWRWQLIQLFEIHVQVYTEFDPGIIGLCWLQPYLSKVAKAFNKASRFVQEVMGQSVLRKYSALFQIASHSNCTFDFNHVRSHAVQNLVPLWEVLYLSREGHPFGNSVHKFVKYRAGLWMKPGPVKLLVL